MVLALKTNVECLNNNKCNKLQRICEYYKISINNKLDVGELTAAVDVYESNSCNSEIVKRRLLLWSYIIELQNDEYTKSFVFFDKYYEDDEWGFYH